MTVDGLAPDRRKSGLHLLSVPVIAQKVMTEEKTPCRRLGFVKLDFLIGTKWGSNAGRKQKPPSRSPNRRRNIPK
jgi:hypothetical protein